MQIQNSDFVIRKLETKQEIEQALKQYARIAVEKLPTLSNLKISAEEYFEKNLKFWIETYFKEDISFGLFEKSTKKLVGSQLNVDLFTDYPKEIGSEREMDPIFDRDEAICFHGFFEMMKEAGIEKVKGKYLYLVVSAKEESVGSGFSFAINEALHKEAINRGYQYFYTEATSPFSQRIWKKMSATHLKKVALEEFVDKNGTKPFAGVDWKKFGFPDEKPAFYFILTKVEKDPLSKL